MHDPAVLGGDLAPGRSTAQAAVKSPGSGERFAQLDAVRGLAALSVVISHYALLFEATVPQPYASIHTVLRFLEWTPLYALFGGHQAVLVFFILSGFVLTLMLDRVSTYGLYLWRRVSRLYIPYAFAVGLAIIFNYLLYRGQISQLSSWFNHFWSQPISTSTIVEHILFLGHYDTDKYDFVIWSLVHEMRISIIFPVVFFIIRRISPLRALVGFGFIAIVSDLVYHELVNSSYAYLSTYPLSFHYLYMFVIGALIALNREGIRQWYRRLSKRRVGALALLAVASYSYGMIPEHLGIMNLTISDWLTLPGAVMLLLFALYSKPAAALLLSATPQFLGRISYSLYLIHPVVQLAVLHGLYGKLPLGLVICLAFGITVPVAYLMYRWVEVPAIGLGRQLSKRTSTRVVADQRSL